MFNTTLIISMLLWKKIGLTKDQTLSFSTNYMTTCITKNPLKKNCWESNNFVGNIYIWLTNKTQHKKVQTSVSKSFWLQQLRSQYSASIYRSNFPNWK